MPALLRMATRTAVVAGTATAVSGHVQRRQANTWADQDQQQFEQQAPPPQQYAAPAPVAAPPAADPIEKLKELGQLHEQGILTDEELAAEKATVLNG